MIAHILGRVRRALVVLALMTIGCGQPKLAGTDLGSTEAPDFTLTDGLTGGTLELSAQRGQIVALTFLYTTCPDVCPLTATQFKLAQDKLASDVDKVTFIAVSVDPERDTPQAAQQFSAAHGLSRNWYYLVGGRAQLAPVWASYGIGVQPSSVTVGHNDAVYLIDRHGRERVLLHSDSLGTDLLGDLRALARES